MYSKTNILWMAFLMVALFISCKEESILEEVEKELPHEPEVIVIDDVLNYRLAETPIYNDEGYGVVQRDSTFDIYAVSSDPITCRQNGVTSVTLFSDSAFVVTFVEFEDSFTAASASFVIDDQFILLFAENQTDPCEFQLPTLDISYVDDKRIEGSMRGRAFQISGIVDSGSVDCSQYKDLGILEADFSVSLQECN
ncbi:MAG: hypothetical protein AAF694_31025 [Bacteroidota bacterium]